MTGKILESYREGDVEVREPLVITSEEYNEILSGRTVHRLWSDKTRQTRSVARGQGRGGSLFRVELPVQFPKLIRSIVGDGAPNIEVSGSESITLSGTSDWVPGQTVQTERQKQSGFPSLEMKQELNVNLTGSIGDKIGVDVDQPSNVQTWSTA
jgi:cell surface protein SprA